MINLSDYIFFRVYKFYQKRDGAPAIYASGVLSVIEFFFLLSLLAFSRLFLDFQLPHKYYVLPVILALIGLNWYRYERDFDIKTLEAKWGHEQPAIRRRKGWLIVIALTIVMLFPILIGILKNNLGVI